MHYPEAPLVSAHVHGNGRYRDSRVDFKNSQRNQSFLDQDIYDIK